MRRGDKRALTTAQQFIFLKSNPICPGSGSLSFRGMIWNYRTRPTILSREYSIQISYHGGDPPKVLVKEPDLSLLAEGRPLPHVYRDPTRLCLYLPGSNEWDNTMRIDQTFVPWTASWLYYFEDWLESSDWKGGGVHPGEEGESDYNRAVRRSARHAYR